jgi:predicted permease
VLGNWAQDLRYAVRQLARHPGYALVAMLTLALGIGPNAAIFGVIYGVLLKPLPYREPDRLVRPVWHWQSPTDGTDALTETQYVFWKAHNRVLDGIAAYARAGAGFNIVAGDAPGYVRGEFVSADLFPLLGVPPARGRGFVAEDERAGGAPVALVSDALWRRRLGADPAAISSTLVINGTAHDVVGVMPPGFAVDGEPADIWLPLTIDPDPRDQGHNTMTIARLKPGVSLARAQADMDLLLGQLRQAIPGHVGDNERGVTLEPYHAQLTAGVRPTLLLLVGAVVLVLLIATANAAALLLGRAAAREREFAVRRALGASGPMAVRPLVVESVLLSLAGGALGLVFADRSLRAMLAVGARDLPFVDAVRIDLPVLGAALLLSIAIGIITGLPPVLRRARAGLHGVMQSGSDRALGPVRQRARSLLVGTQLALSTALLAGAVLLIVSMAKLWSTDPGFDPRDVWTVQMSLPPAQYRTEQQASRFFEAVRQNLAALPGVSSVATASSLPLERGLNLWIQAIRNGERTGQITEGRVVSGEYFRTLGIPIARGRPLEATDARGATPIAVVNRRLAELLWQDRDPIGETIWVENVATRVVGVVGDVREFGLDSRPPQVLYLPESQVADGLGGSIRQWFLSSWIVKSRVPLGRDAVERAVHAVDPAQPVVSLRPMNEVVASWLGPRRFVGRLLDLFAALALLLAAVGVYGVVAYSAGQRRRELGLRAALGARRDELVRLVLGEGLRLAVGGALVGVGLAVALTRFLRGFLFGVGPTNPLVLAAACVGLTAVALVASFLPARRAALADPMEALRHE